jgi:hypothetical protein
MSTAQATNAGIEKTKKSFASKFMNFLMYGGFLVVIAVGLAIVILLDVYVF